MCYVHTTNVIHAHHVCLCERHIKDLRNNLKDVNEHRRPPVHTKIDEIEHIYICCQESVDILCVSESWLNNPTPDDDIMITDYQLYERPAQEIKMEVVQLDMYMNLYLSKKGRIWISISRDGPYRN